MIDDSPQIHLDALKNALNLLKSYSLPVETRLTVLKAIQHAERLTDYLVENPEQTRLAALYEVSQVLGKSLDLDEVLNQVMDAVIELTGAERGFLMLIDSDTELHLRAARNIERESLEHKDMEVSRTVIQTVVNEGEGVVTTDAQTDPRFAGQESVIIFSLRSILCAPLRMRGQIIGVIYVENRAQSGIFTERDLEMLSAFATQAAIAIENARLYTRTDQALNERVIELETLTNIDRQLNAQLELKRVAEITHRWAKSGTQADQSWIILKEDDDALTSLDEDGVSISYPNGEELYEIYQTVVASNQPKVFPVNTENRFHIASPIVIAGESIGALIVERSEPFTDNAVQFLERLTGRSSAAIGNARLYQEVQQANEAKTKFISVVTHELRIPMTSIRGYTDLLSTGAVGSTNEQQQNFLRIINNNIDRMSALVSDLSDISRIETGRLNLHLEAFSITDYVRETISSLSPKLDEKNHHLEINLPEGLPFVYADSNRVVQILSNLISNAWKYTPTEGNIIINAWEQDQFIHLEVHDNGVGISKEDQAHLFTQFFRSEDQAVRDEQGWGLGLNVTKRLVNLMGGEIGVNSKLGGGSTFWFTLPTTAPEGES